MAIMLVSCVSLGLFVLFSAAAPLLAGRWLADHDDREDERGERDRSDPEIATIEAHALILLAGASRDRFTR